MTELSNASSQPTVPKSSSLLRPVPVGDTPPKPNRLTRKKPKTNIKLNVPLLVGTIIVLAILGASAYVWHSNQVKYTASTFLVRADQLEAEENWALAADYLFRYSRFHPDDADVAVRLAKTYDRSAQNVQRKSRAVDLYYRAIGVAEGKDHRALRVRVAELNLELGPNEPSRFFLAAEADARTLLAADDQDPQGHRLLTLALLGNIQAHSSLLTSDKVIGAQLERAWKLNPDDIQIALAMAAAYRMGLDILTPEQRMLPDAQRAQLADDIIDGMVQAIPDRAEAFLARYRYRSHHGLEGADDDLRAALQYEPDSVQVRVFAARRAQELAASLGSTGQADNHYQEAERHYKYILSAAGGAPKTAYLGLGEVYLAQGDVDRAIETLRQGLTVVGQEDIELNANLAFALITTGQLDEAAAVLGKFEDVVAAQGPAMPRTTRFTVQRAANLLRGQWLATKGEHQKAIPLLEDVILGQAESDIEIRQRFRAWTLIGRSYSALRRWPLAAAAFEQAARIQPNNLDPLKAQADVWLRSGQWNEAISLYQQVLAVEESPEARLALARAHFRSQTQLTENQRDWAPFEKALRELQRLQTEMPLRDAWRAAFLEADYKIARAQDPEKPASDQSAGATADAVALLREVEKEFPESAEFWRAVTVYYANLGATDDANRAAQFYASLAAGSPEAYLLRASLYIGRGQYEKARAMLTSGVDKLPPESRLPLELRLHQISAAQGNIPQARQELRQLQKEHPTSVEVLQQLAELVLQSTDLEELGQYETQLRTLEGQTGLYWRYYRARRLIADAESANDPRLVEADQLRAEIQLEQPGWPQGRLLAGLIHQARGNYPQAITAYKVAVRAGDQTSFTYARLIGLLYASRQFEEADTFLAHLEARGDVNPFFTSIRISLDEKAGRWDSAIEVARREVERLPENLAARLRLSQVLFAKAQWLRRDAGGGDELKETEAALIEAVEVARASGDDAQGKAAALLQLANVRVMQHRNEDAIGLYRQVLDVDGGNAAALNNLATLLAESDEADRRAEARRFVDRAIELQGPQAMFLDTMGMSFYHDGNSEAAIERLEAAVSAPDADPRFFFHLALAYDLAGRTAQARGTFRDAQSNGLEATILTATERKLLQNFEARLNQ